MLNILHRDYPDVAGEITRQIDGVLPAFRIGDSRKVPVIVNAFNEAAGITDKDWSRHDRITIALSNNDIRLCKITEAREILIAVVLLFFHPARILGLDSGPTKPGMLKELAHITGCTKVVLSQNLGNAVTRYRAYKGFKTEVDYLYEQVKEKINIAGC